MGQDFIMLGLAVLTFPFSIIWYPMYRSSRKKSQALQEIARNTRRSSE